MIVNNADLAIVVITRNRRNELAQVLDGIEKNTTTDYSLAVSIDRSEDDTEAYLQKRYEGLTGFRILTPPKPGAPASRNISFYTFRDRKFIIVFEDDYFPIKEGWEIPHLAALEKVPCLFSLVETVHGPILDSKRVLTSYQGITDSQIILYRERLTSFMVAINTSILSTLGYFNPGYEDRYGFEDSEWGSRGRDSGLFGCIKGFPTLDMEDYFYSIPNPTSSDNKTVEQRLLDTKANESLFITHGQRPVFLSYPYEGHE